MNWVKFWASFWKGFDTDPKNLQGLVFQSKTGEWKTAIVPPNSTEAIAVEIEFDPWTGERLETNQDEQS